jgi:hypothetical protein
MTPDRQHALNKKHRGAAAPGDLIGDVPLGLFHTEWLQLLGQLPVADMPPLQFGLQDTLHPVLPIFIRCHPILKIGMDIIVSDVFCVDNVIDNHHI